MTEELDQPHLKEFNDRILKSRKLKRPRTSKSIRNAWMKN